jgi:predicted hydrocarbon binding protein
MIEQNKTQNFVMAAWLETVENIVGSNGLHSILNYAGLQKYIGNPPPDNDCNEIPIEDLQNLHRALLVFFGGKGTKMIQLRAGREFAGNAIGKHPKIAKTVKLAARLLPENKKIRLVLERWGDEIEKREPSETHKPRVELREEEDCFIYTDWDNYLTEGMKSSEPVCSFYVGELEYLVEWISGHKYEVEEIECRAAGHPADVFKIYKAGNNSS